MQRIFSVLGTVCFFAIILIAIAAGKIGGKAASKSVSSPSKEQLVAAAVAEANKRVPLMLDNATRLDSALAIDGGESLAYNYTILNYRANQLSTTQLQAFREFIVNQTCGNQAKTLISNGIPLQFNYQSSDGLPVQSVVIRPGKCIFDPYKKAYGLAP